MTPAATLDLAGRAQSADWNWARTATFSLPDTARLEELCRRYAGGLPQANVLRRLRWWQRKAAWFLATQGAPAAKRGIDIVGALLLLVLLSPLLLVVALLIKLADGGPVLFWQTRVGRWGREFPFPKFRSMVVDAERLQGCFLDQNDRKDGVTFKMRRDPRTTRVGRIIRWLSIDELPQLWSVLKGEMSLVGPRPPVPQEVALYTLHDRRRLEVIPGLTCIWQVSGRANIPFSQQVELDVQYIGSQSLWLDLKLISLTIPAVFSGRGAF